MSVAAVTQTFENLQIALLPHEQALANITGALGAILRRELLAIIGAYDDRGQYFLRARTNQDLVAVASTSALTELDFSMHAFLNPATVLQVLQAMPHVERMRLPPAVAEDVLHASCVIPIPKGRVRITQLLLQVPGIRLNKVYMRQVDGYSETALNAVKTEIAALETRVQAGHEQAAMSSADEALAEVRAVEQLFVRRGACLAKDCAPQPRARLRH